MSITREEKEQLFEEFKERLEKEKGTKPQGYASGYKTFHNLEQAKDHFWEKYNQMVDEYEPEVWTENGMKSFNWDLIRRLVCSANGVSLVSDILPENVNESNRLAIRLIDLLFDYNDQILKEKESR